MSFAKTAFCVGKDCNRERPCRRAVTGRGWVCMFCGEPVQLPSKYRNEPTRSRHTGRIFQSKKESRREPTLLALQNAGAICELRYQVPFRLELYATGAVDELLDVLDHRGEVYDASLPRLITAVRRSRQMVCKWVADFTYQQHGALVAEDVKGHATQLYRLKKKLVELAHNLEIVEPSEGGVQQKARGAGIRGRGTGASFVGGR